MSKKDESRCPSCDAILRTDEEIDEELCFRCSYEDDFGDPAERGMNEQMLINLGM